MIMKTTKELLKMAKEQNTTVDGLFRSPKRLSLENIESLPKASVIWREEHIITSGGNSGVEYFQLQPMMIGVPGKKGVLCYADLDGYIILDIDENLITDTRFFWDAEPDPAVITSGIPEEEYNNLWDSSEYGYDDLQKMEDSRIVYAITKRGFTLDMFSQASGISKARLIMILRDPAQLTVSELDVFKQFLSLSADEAMNLFFTEK